MPGRRQHGEGSLYKRSRDGRWVAAVELDWKDGKRQRRLFTGSDPAEAMAKRDVFLSRRRDGFILPAGRSATVGQWCEHWLVNIAQPRVEPTTFHGSYESKVRRHIIPYFERVPLPEFSEEHVEAFHRHLSRSLAPASVVQVHRILSSAVKAAVIRGRIPRNPVSNVPPPRITREAAVPSDDEIRRILAACEEWPNGPRWILAILTGARQGEMLALRWSDADLGEEPSVTIRRSAARVNGELVYKQPKSKQSRRTVAIGPAAAAALRRQRKRQVPNIGSDLVFTDDYGRPVHPRADYADWQALLSSLGIGAYPVHSLRHAAATLMLEAGQDVKVVQARLGHSSPAFTQAQYQHVRPVLNRKAADAMERFLSERP